MALEYEPAVSLPRQAPCPHREYLGPMMRANKGLALLGTPQFIVRLVSTGPVNIVVVAVKPVILWRGNEWVERGDCQALEW